MLGKKLTTNDKVFKAKFLSCPYCEGRGFTLFAKYVFGNEHSFQYYECSVCQPRYNYPVVGLRKGWGRLSVKSIEELRRLSMIEKVRRQRACG